MQWVEGMLVATSFKEGGKTWLRIIELISVHPEGILGITESGKYFSYYPEQWEEARPFPVGHVEKRLWGLYEVWIYTQQKKAS